ncbi:MAG: SpoIIE family protein phosphatase [Leptospiraceae bacterium]|nr:SpoIIE family protein phosphatase [Leptospiraceae bacterium]MDW8306486.1 SpoIIE family protein phosphatase [Leptospiraceae bacterium]
MRKIGSFLQYQVGKLTSYAISVALSSGISSILAVFFVFYFAEAAKLPMNEILMNTLLAFIGIAWIMHSLHFGILHQIGFSGFTQDIRLLNKSVIFEKGKIYLKEGLDPEVYLRLLHILRHIPFTNAWVALFWAVLIGVAFLTVGITTGAFAPKHYPLIIATGLIAFSIHWGFSLVIGELASGPLRAECKKVLHQKKIDYEDKALTTINFKLGLFLGLFIITIFVSNYLTYSAVIEERNIHSTIAFGIIAVSTALFVTYLIFAIIRQSLKELEAAAEDLKSGGEGHLYPRSLDREFINVASGFIKATKTIKDYQKNLEHKVEERTRQLREANEELSQKDAIMQMELDFAAEIQKGIIPSQIPEWNGLSLTAHWRAMEKVSGDFYDVFPMQGNHLGILIADVSGHGVPAALITTMAKVAFSKAAQESHRPAEIFRKVNDQLVRMIHTQDYLTAFLVAIDENHHFLYANASHQTGKLWRAESRKIEQLDTNGLFVGALAEASDSYEEKRNKLMPGDKLLLHTDGLTEYRNKDGQEYGQERLEKVLQEFGHLSADELLGKILLSLEEFADGAAANDDLSLVIIEAKPAYTSFREKVSQVKSLMAQGYKQKAVKVLDEAIELYPRHPQTLKIAGYLNYELGRISKAAQYLQQYIQLNTQNAEVYYWLSLIYYKMQRYELAMMHAQQALSLKPNFVEAQNTLALALANLGKKEEAEQHLLKALNQNPDNQILRKNLHTLKQS